MPENALGLMAKYPRPGRVKTRLAAAIGERRAYDIYCRLLDRAISQVVTVDQEHTLRAVFIEPAEKAAAFAAQHPGFDTIRPQAGGDLGQRMQEALEYLLARPDVSCACLIGADIPEITGEIIENAWQALTNNDIVVGPTIDGGYYLIGMKHMHPELFTGVVWGSESVWETTMAIAKKLNLTVGILPSLRDLDDVEDYKHFAARGVFD